MFEKLGHFAVRRKKFAVITFILTILISGAVGSQVIDRLVSGGDRKSVV